MTTATASPSPPINELRSAMFITWSIIICNVEWALDIRLIPFQLRFVLAVCSAQHRAQHVQHECRERWKCRCHTKLSHLSLPRICWSHLMPTKWLHFVYHNLSFHFCGQTFPHTHTHIHEHTFSVDILLQLSRPTLILSSFMFFFFFSL